jgi:hypothetical protein
MKTLLTPIFSFITLSVLGFHATINVTTVPENAIIYFGGQFYGTRNAIIELKMQ